LLVEVLQRVPESVFGARGPTQRIAPSAERVPAVAEGIGVSLLAAATGLGQLTVLAASAAIAFVGATAFRHPDATESLLATSLSTARRLLAALLAARLRLLTTRLLTALRHLDATGSLLTALRRLLTAGL
jgi:hypothetical protein